MAEDRFCFLTEWYDPSAALNRRYQLFYYPSDNTVEMYDVKNHKAFLRRTKCDNLNMGQLFIGSTVNIMSRQITFTDYGDDFTRKQLSAKKQSTLAMIKPDAMPKMGQIIDLICSSGFLITRMKMCRLSRNQAFDFYQEHQSKNFFGALVDHMTSGPVVAIELMGEGAMTQWRSMLGPTDSSAARSQAPGSIRARFGTDNTRNACHGSDSPGSAARELEFFFPSQGTGVVNTASFTDCTCCIIKPHVLLSGQAGAIISDIADAGFQITAMTLFHMEKANAEEFYEVYKGVVHEYPEMVNQLIAGPCIALEIRAQDAPRAFREYTGPADPEIARHLRPRTLRARYGQNKVQNAVHCTDLAEDGLLEVEYFFKILDA